MIKLNNTQVKGLAILISSAVASFLIENTLVQILTGILCAVGLSYILKFIPFKLKDLNLRNNRRST